MGLTRIKAEQISDIDYKQAVRVVTTSNITLTGGAPTVVDGVTLQANDRILVTAQDPGSQNGLYQVQTLGTGSNGTWVRTTDANQDGEIEAGMVVMVTEGEVYADTPWKLTTNNPIILGTTSLTFVVSSGSGAPGGANTQVQYNDSGTLGASAAFTFDKASNVVTVSGNVNATNFIGNGSALTGVTATASPAGPANAVQYNNGGVTGGSANLTFNGTNVVATGNITASYFIGNGSQLTGISSTSSDGNLASNVILGLNSANTITFNGVVASNIIPSANVTYNLGNTTNRWNDIWLANSTIYIGEANISSTGANLNLPSNVAVGTATLSAASGNLALPTGTTVGGVVVETPRVANCQIATSGWVVKDDTAVALSGGYIIINGAGFVAGASVIVGSAAAAAVTVVNSTTIQAQVNAASAGTYVIYVVNPDGSVGILVNGLTYSDTPTWTTGSTLTSQLSNVAISIQLSATGANTYAVSAGNTLPTGLTLSSSGLLSGTVTVEQQTVYSFSVDAIDTELQESPRTFSLTIATAPVDPYFEYVTVLLHGDGANTAQNNTFLDSSTNNFTINRFGDATQGTNTPFSRPAGYWSNYFDGTGDSLSNSTTLITQNVSTFTVEGWIYMTANPTSDAYNIPGLIALDGTPAGASNYMSFGPVSNRVLRLRWYDTDGRAAIGSTTLNLNQWYHVACVVTSNAIQFYVNGVAETMSGTTTLAARTGTTTSFSIGANVYGTFAGYLSNLRVTTTAVYTGAFTPPVAPLTAVTGTVLLTCQNNRFVDNSTNNYTLTRGGDTKVLVFVPFNPPDFYQTTTNGGSASFDGSGDYLTVGGNSVLNVGTGDYTIEFWMYMNSAPNDYVNLFSYTQAAQTTGIRLGNSGFGLKLQFGPYLESLGGLNSIALIQQDFVGRWRHVAMTRASNQLRLFVDGQLQNSGTGVNPSTFPNASVTDNTSLTTSSACQLVQDNFPGYISGLRVIKNTALYTSSFSLPTTPPTAVSGTSLLLNFINGGIIDNAMMTDWVTVGNAQVRTNIKKYGTGSMYFDGTDDRLTTPTTPNVAFGTGDFTIEFWSYPTNIGINGGGGHFQTSSSVGGLQAGYTTGIVSVVGVNSAGQNSSGGWFVTVNNTFYGSGGGGAFAVDTWHHVAITRSSGTLRGFINGTQIWTATNTSSIDGQNLVIGGYYNTSYLYQGYLDDFRITKGYARYTANFTPPTEAFPDF